VQASLEHLQTGWQATSHLSPWFCGLAVKSSSKYSVTMQASLCLLGIVACLYRS
jgi:hypothetical protein